MCPFFFSFVLSVFASLYDAGEIGRRKGLACVEYRRKEVPKKKASLFLYRALTTGGMSPNVIAPVVGSMTRQRRSRFRMSIDGGFHYRNSWLFYHHVFLALLFSLCLRLFFFCVNEKPLTSFFRFLL